MKRPYCLYAALATLLVPSSALCSENRLLNPDFDEDLELWTSSPPAEWSPFDVDDDPSSGSALAEATCDFIFCAAGLRYEPCLAVEGGEELLVELSGYPLDFGGDGHQFLEWYETDDCTGPFDLFSAEAEEVFPQEWFRMSRSVTVPGSARSCVFSFTVQENFGVEFSVHFDKIFFGSAPLFRDGFESGDLSRWSFAVP